ncbi:restriction endonuclease [Pseudobacteroides cellulosolvens]|uniref:Restriction endonuclease n=1 Tax=Pseudobacteroides cellulosolvens ATCC 35603 = DSM 2933 TaxID=398512 RepID=A0A0L6JY52_9FIRM|nr:restriction endonuclease [Pseudobacteroides cellulosolvens]KNY30475.1 restriction endonuclease [Pseudobacteroides cellulosolvens ATCC 35603 = DSM 2933]
MRKLIDEDVKKKLNKIKFAIEEIPNTVPSEMRTTFNFKGRKSPAIAEKVIKTICNENDSLYDPFMGSGSFVFAAMGNVKKIYGTELDNYTFFAVEALMTKADMAKLAELFQQVKDNVYKKIMNLYAASCCGQKNYISKVLFDPDEGKDGYFYPSENREIIDGKNVKLVEKCPICGEKAKKFDNDDYIKIKSLDSEDVSRFPKHKYIENSRINITASRGADRYDRIFTHRNKIALLYLQDSINQLEESFERDILEHILVASISLARIAMYGSSTDILYHVVGHGAQDMNVWLLFEEKYKNFCKFKTVYADCQIGTSKSEINISNSDYAKYIDNHPELKVDVIYTDFPYTDQVPYLERNQLYRVWLEKFYNNSFKLSDEMLNQEIVQTDAPTRTNKQDIESYYKDIDNMFAHFSMVLKEKGLVLLTMKLGKAKYFKTYIEIVNLARKNGFEYAYQVGVEKNDPTIRKQSAFTNTFMNEMIVVFYKLPEEEKYWYIYNDNYEFLLVKKVYAYIINSKNYVTVSSAVSLICNDMKSKYGKTANNEVIERIRKVLGEYFVIDAGIIQIDSNQLYLDIEDSTDLYTKLYDLMPIFIRQLLNNKGKFVLEDVYFELVNALCDGNPKTIAQIIEDESHQRDIENLISNYCEKEGQYYVERKDIIKPKDDAIDISTLSGTDFEILVQSLLKAEGYENVVKMGGAGDLGVDIIASKRQKEKILHYIFQCKRWASNVGSDPIQRLYAERERRGLDYAVCVTTSGYTKDGKMVAEDLNVEMVDGTALMKRLNKHFPGEYYNGIIDI